MSRSHRPHNVAFVEDCDEDSGSFEGINSTRRYAVSEVPDTPPKTRPNTGKSRSNEQHRPPPARRGESSASNSDSTTHSRKGHESKRDKEARRQAEHEREERRKKEEKRERDARRLKAEERAAKESSRALKKIRPPPARHATLPVVQQTGQRRGHDDPRAYGIQQPAVTGSRPRANTRPASYYAGQPGPPPSNMGWPPGHGMPPQPFPVGTFPPPQMFQGSPIHGMPIPLPPPSPSNPGSYLDGPPPLLHGRDLRQRFEPRPSSAMGFSPSAGSYLQEEYGYDDEPPLPQMGRRPSHNRGHEEDRRRMPPPDFIPSRPKTTANPSTPFNLPPPSRPASRHGHGQSRSKGAHRRSVGFNERHPHDEEDLISAEDLFHDISPEPVYERNRPSAARSRYASVYDDEDDDDEYDASPGARRFDRRGSMHAVALGSGGVSLERDRYLDAMRYQDDVTGGQQVPLTAETLRKANKRGEGTSSRSTRSSESRDESEYKRSYTTGITRSSSGANDDFTIKVSGQAVVRVQGAEIECEDSEITVSNRLPVGSFRGSDRASTVFQHQLEDSRDSRSRFKALPHRPRAPSQSDSQSRYAPSHAPYEHAPYEPASYDHAPYDPNYLHYY